MAPISDKMRNRYDYAVETGLAAVGEDCSPDQVDPDGLSELKGMFNRSIRQDQWDWFSVHTELDRPTPSDMRRIVAWLTEMLRAVLALDEAKFEATKVRLQRANLLHMLQEYSGKESNLYCGYSQ